MGIELGAACMPSGHASDRATAPIEGSNQFCKGRQLNCHSSAVTFFAETCMRPKPLDHYSINEPPHDKTNKMTVYPAKTQIMLGSKLSSCTYWRQLNEQAYVKRVLITYSDSEGSDKTVKAQTSLRIRAVSPEPLLFAHIIMIIYGPEDSFRQKAEDFASLRGWACTFVWPQTALHLGSFSNEMVQINTFQDVVVTLRLF